MITTHALTFAYQGQAPLFQDFFWQAARGESWTVLGPSGCGKTTLLYLLVGLLHPTSGLIEIDGERLIRPRPHTGLILQDYGLLPWATIKQNAELGLRVRDFYGPDGTHAPLRRAPGPDVTYWLERLGIAAIAHKYPGQISGGQRQRAAIARTLALQPDLLLMDEPFSSLDAVTREDLQGLTLDLCAEQGLTMVMVTHSIEEAALMGRKILFLHHPPNQRPEIHDNPGAGSEAYRQDDAYFDLCRKLRQVMSHEDTA